MSYGIGVVILKDDLEKQQIRWDVCDWSLPICVKTHPKSCLNSFKRWYKEFETETKITSLKKLQKAPCDCVCIIDKEGNLSTLKDHKPISTVGVSNIITHLIQYLQI